MVWRWQRKHVGRNGRKGVDRKEDRERERERERERREGTER